MSDRWRIDHPDASLAELGALHEPPLTKHAVSGIIRRAKKWVAR
ncbi:MULTISPECIES: helix-turn-helix domain-containing protein [Mycobacterium]|nr:MULTISPECIES: helix-turn-helix domain-containing protein [Mycobacterium]MDO2351638.1 helix-turn-helix domain-containing protein [Mycobacterium avium subsp. hominissuis]